jgi:hypothetical protein
MNQAIDDLQCGKQRHLTLYHANPEWGMRMCNLVRSACRNYQDLPVSMQHINMGCSTFGNAKAICRAASQIATGFKKRCGEFNNKIYTLTGNTVDNWFPSAPGSCSWERPDGHAVGSNYGSIRKLKATKAGFIACQKVNGKWVDDPQFCAGTANYLPPGSPNRPKELDCGLL